MHRAHHRPPAGATGDQPGIFARKDKIPERERLGIVLEGVEKRQSIKGRGAKLGLIEHRLPRQRRVLRRF
jgi:hypothetical protein